MKVRPCSLLLALFAGAATAAAAPRANPEPVRWTVTLEDGSRLTGAPALARLELVGTLLARAELDPAHVAALRLDANGETWTVLGADGERLTGAIRSEVLPLDTGLGRLDLPFEHVVSVVAGGAVGALPAPAPGAGRFGERADGFEPEDVLVDFETDPAGRPLAVSADLSATFVPLGLRLATSVEGSYPAVDAYVVGSRSGGSSCATRSPRWTGTLTLSFCEPGRPERPATVSRVGLWVAAVAPNGTRLRALGPDGEVLAEAATTTSGSERLVVRSERPIASVQVIPNESIDPNYTIDDVVFDAPRPLGASGAVPTHTVELRTGDVIAAREVELDGADVVLSGLTLGVDRLRVLRDAVLSIRFPAPAGAGAEGLARELAGLGAR